MSVEKKLCPPSIKSTPQTLPATTSTSVVSSCCTPTITGGRSGSAINSTSSSSISLIKPSLSSSSYSRGGGEGGGEQKITSTTDHHQLLQPLPSILHQQPNCSTNITKSSYHGHHSPKQDFVPFGHSQDYLELEPGSRGSPLFGGSTLGVNPRVLTKANSITMMNLGCDDAEVMFVDQDDIITLTHQVKNFSDALTKLKTVFTEGTICGDDVKVAAHEQLGEVLCTLRQVLQQYLALQSEDLFSAAANLINKIKNYNYEDTISTAGNTQSFCDSIDQLALAFSSSVSEYLMGDMDVLCPVEIGKTKSYEVIPTVAESSPRTPLDENKEIGVMGPEEVNVILKHLDSGVDKALQRAKVWSKYLKDIIYYIDKKAQLESEFSKNLIRLAQAAKPTLMEDAFLPLQSVYCTLLSQDTEYATNCQATQNLLQTQKFVRPLSSRRAEHDKIRKMVKETWSRELKKMHESISNLRKARSLYYNRKQEYEKAYELAMKTESEMLSQSGSSGSGTISSKVDKRKKMVEETMNRASEAEMTYKECILEANNRQQDLDKIKGDLLSKVYEQIFLCDSTIKSVTVEYFNLLHTVTAPLPLRFMTLCETSKQYEPASQYAEFVRRLPNTSSPQTAEPFAFEPYVPPKLSDDRKPSVHSSASYSSEILSQDGSPICYDIHSQGSHGKDWQCSDSDSSNSPESSPPTSPRGQITLEATTTNSMEDLLQGYSEESESSSHTKSSKTTESSSKQRYHHHHHHHHRHHGECARTFGVKLEDHVRIYNTDVPLIVKKCLNEIEKKGITIKGIYRVSGVKSKVEGLCKQFEADPEGVDLTEQHPNVITSVLKMYLRQLPEPLLTFDAYASFIQVAKRDMVGNLSKEQTVQKLDELIQTLPPANRKTTALIIWHLRQVSEEANENQMNASNLGIVFGPTLLRPLEGTASLSSLVDTPHQTRAVELLITYADQLFGEKMETVLTSTPDSSSGKEKFERIPSIKPSRRDQLSESAGPEESSTPESSVVETSALPALVPQSPDTSPLTTALDTQSPRSPIPPASVSSATTAKKNQQKTTVKQRCSQSPPRNVPEKNLLLTATKSLDSLAPSTAFSTPAGAAAAGFASAPHTARSSKVPCEYGYVEIPASAHRHFKPPSVVTAKMCVKTTAPKSPQKYKDDQYESVPTLVGSAQRMSGHRNLVSSSSAPVVLTSVTPMGQDYGDSGGAKLSAQESVSLSKKESTKSPIAKGGVVPLASPTQKGVVVPPTQSASPTPKGVVSPTQSASPTPDLQSSLIAPSASSDDREPRFV